LERLSDLRAKTAEAAVTAGGGWLVVPAVKFKGREGQVMGKTWLLNGEEGGLNSLAAYRALLPGESPSPMLYRFADSLTADGIQRWLLVKSWQSQVSLRLRNPAAFSWRFEAQTGLGKKQGELSPGEEIVLQMPIDHETPSEVVLDFHATLSARDQIAYPTATLTWP
jgi:hypothetical protein